MTPRRGGAAIADVVAELETQLGSRCAARLELPAEPEQLADDVELPPAIVAALATRGVRRL
ncbi:MAG: hypothetical protein NDJ75_06120, partial [Thermoanaerobaculia bacterium]|nr:hypothetical protein [Thermoanaerobaculia bacterium]